MKMKIKFHNLETSSTISWLLMDYFWMIDYMFIALILSFTSIILSILSIFYYDGKIESEKYLLSATLTWILMNSTSLWGEYNKIKWLSEISNIFFIFTIVLIAATFFISRKNKETINFKRLKIK